MEEVGYLKYKGSLVEQGVIDAKSAGMALVGLDETIRYFNSRQSSEFAKLEYDIPVHIEDGSWVAIVLAGVAAVGGAFALGYAKKAGEKMAENDFKDIGLSDVFKKSFSALSSLLRLSKHTGKSKDWDLDNVVWRNNNKEIGVYNNSGELIFIEVEYIKWFQSMPPSLISKLTDPIREHRTLAIGTKTADGFEEQEVSNQEKKIFSKSFEEDDCDEFIFPEIQHGDDVQLEGKLTRGNEQSNTVGFEYQGHILNCIPEEGTIVRYKPALFLKCIIEGTAVRHSKKRVSPDRKPTIIVKNIIPLNAEHQDGLF
ncbi:hypothetical protein ACMXYO_08680 [Neptuniibacter sp. QD37_6]|uniref:hypothetical protein n=1 Tax=Neptuniibacter sp. QD37_6 TaxID=3398210 RepID=UPI0039F61389